MKIAITGAHNTGKTTLALWLQQLLPGHSVKQGACYELDAWDHVFVQTPDTADFLIALRQALAEEGRIEGHIIFDRCPLDCLAYMQALGAFALVYDWYDEVVAFMARIDILVYVPVETPERIDTAADVLPGLRQAVYKIIGTWVADFETELVEVRGSPSGRAGQVLEQVFSAGY